jgi:ketosteroid isomerase-like protein
MSSSTATPINRRKLLSAAGAAIGAAALAAPVAAIADVSHDSEQIGEIYQLQAAFHRAKSHQDIDLMVSLWTDDCTLTFNGATYSGKDAIRAFFLTTPTWHHHRISLVPSFKDQIEVHGDTAFLYYECHDVALDTNDPAGAPGTFVSHLTNYGTIRKVGDSWQFSHMNGGPAGLSVDTIYHP